MKKKLVLMMAVCFALLVVVGCGSISTKSIVGVYESENGFIYRLNEDGTAEYYLGGYFTPMGEWEVKDGYVFTKWGKAEILKDNDILRFDNYPGYWKKIVNDSDYSKVKSKVFNEEDKNGDSIIDVSKGNDGEGDSIGDVYVDKDINPIVGVYSSYTSSEDPKGNLFKFNEDGTLGFGFFYRGSTYTEDDFDFIGEWLIKDGYVHLTAYGENIASVEIIMEDGKMGFWLDSEHSDEKVYYRKID